MLAKECNSDSNEAANTIRIVTKIYGKARAISVHLPAKNHIETWNNVKSSVLDIKD